jgi:hypothetical protein
MVTNRNGHDAQLVVTLVSSSQEMVAADIRDQRLDTVGLFSQLAEAQREQLASDAWSIGLRALANAHARAQEARLQDIGKELIGEIDRQLKTHIEDQQQTIATVLGRFFDPRDGQVSQRLASFVDDQGVLARLLDKYLAPQNSVLAQTLARQMGETSPLFKKLSPTDSEGLVKILEAQLREVMDDGHAELVRALDPLAEDGAVARFLRSLREELKSADEDRAKQLAAALAALNANDENSLLSRLMRETTRARQAVLHAVNPDALDSPMAIMKQTLAAMLKDHARSQEELLRRHQERQEQMDREIRDALARLETRREEVQKSPSGGFDFEDAVIEFVGAALRHAPCVLEVTGNTTGARSRCKKGDAVVRFTSESAFAGASVVFEAKRDASYTVQRALEELDTARANRNACAGVFVMARSHAPATFPSVARFGQNVIVIWDDVDRATDPYLHAAILLGLGLVTRGQQAGDQRDIDALSDIEGRIEQELTRLDRMEKSTDQIRKHSDTIDDEIRKARKQLDLLLRKAQDTLKALNVELREEAIERASPIALAPDSLAVATTCLASGKAAANE